MRTQKKDAINFLPASRRSTGEGGIVDRKPPRAIARKLPLPQKSFKYILHDIGIKITYALRDRVAYGVIENEFNLKK